MGKALKYLAVLAKFVPIVESFDRLNDGEAVEFKGVRIVWKGRRFEISGVIKSL